VQYMSKYDDLNVLFNLLEKGYLKVDEEYGHKCTLLHYAALRGCRKLTDELIKKGADIHAVNAWGKQPIDYARSFEKDHREIGWIFLWRGAGVIGRLQDQCDRKHILKQEVTRLCYLSRRVLDDEFSPEEAAWLRNSCTYSISFAQ
jgi:ankyrin repeat protein